MWKFSRQIIIESGQLLGVILLNGFFGEFPYHWQTYCSLYTKVYLKFEELLNCNYLLWLYRNSNIILDNLSILSYCSHPSCKSNAQNWVLSLYFFSLLSWVIINYISIILKSFSYWKCFLESYWRDSSCKNIQQKIG